MKPIDAKSSTYIDCSKEIHNKDPKFKTVNIVIISKYIFAKDYVQINLRKFLRLKKLKTLFHGHVISDRKMEKIVGTFYEKDKKLLKVEKIIKKNNDKLYVKLKDFDSSFNSWVDKKDIV